jgi:hypothetical protein
MMVNYGLNVGDIRMHYEDDIEHGALRKRFIEEKDVLSALALLKEKLIRSHCSEESCLRYNDGKLCDECQREWDIVKECFQLKEVKE